MSPVVFAGVAAVAVTLPAAAGVLSSAVIAADVAPLANAGMVTVRVTVLPDAGSKLPADLAGVATMRVASLANVGEIALGVTDSAVARAVRLASAGGMFPAVFPGQVAAGAPVQAHDVSVNVLGIQTCKVWGDRFSPGVWCRDKTLGRQNCNFHPAGSLCSGWVHSASSVAMGASAPLLCDLECPVTEDITCWEHLDILGDDSYDYADDGCDHPGDFDYDDPRDYEEWYDWNDTETVEGYYHPDHLHEDGGFMYFKYAFEPELDQAVLSEQKIVWQSAELPSLCSI